jgi:Fis family transcriptional regulator
MPRERASARAAGSHHKTASDSAFKDVDHRPLHRCVEGALTAYFAALDGEDTSGLYDLVICEVERPLLECVMRHVCQNQSRAAAILGVSRGTLHKKLIQHGLLRL